MIDTRLFGVKFEFNWMERLQFDCVLLQNVLPAVFNPDKELAIAVANVLRVWLFLQQDAHVHLRMKLLVGKMNRHVLPAHFTQESEELPPEPVILLRITIFCHAPAPEVLDS